MEYEGRVEGLLGNGVPLFVVYIGEIKKNHQEIFYRPVYLAYDVLKRIRDYYKFDKVNKYISMFPCANVLIGWKLLPKG